MKVGKLKGLKYICIERKMLPFHVVCSCKHTSFEFVPFCDICSRLIFSANRLSASKWSGSVYMYVQKKKRERERNKDERKHISRYVHVTFTFTWFIRGHVRPNEFARKIFSCTRVIMLQNQFFFY